MLGAHVSNVSAIQWQLLHPWNSIRTNRAIAIAKWSADHNEDYMFNVHSNLGVPVSFEVQCVNVDAHDKCIKNDNNNRAKAFGLWTKAAQPTPFVTHECARIRPFWNIPFSMSMGDVERWRLLLGFSAAYERFFRIFSRNTVWIYCRFAVELNIHICGGKCVASNETTLWMQLWWGDSCRLCCVIFISFGQRCAAMPKWKSDRAKCQRDFHNFKYSASAKTHIVLRHTIIAWQFCMCDARLRQCQCVQTDENREIWNKEGKTRKMYFNG